MNDELKAAVIAANCARAQIRALGMLAENQQRGLMGQPYAYTEEAFNKVIEEEGIGYNDVMKFALDR
jgi:hypothetical protein